MSCSNFLKIQSACRIIRYLKSGIGMNNLVLALISAASRFELWDEKIVNQDEASEALDQIKYILADCNDEEKKILA